MTVTKPPIDDGGAGASGGLPRAHRHDDRPRAAEAGPVDPGFFDDAYYRLLSQFHTEADTRRETAAVREILGLAQTDRLLDLGCGWGRHLRLLAEAGHRVVGLDLSVALLRRARGQQGTEPDAGTENRSQRPPGRWPGGRGDAPLLVAGDMLELPLRDGSFDDVINLATSLGLFLDHATALRALTEVRRVLRPGGGFLLEGMHRADVEAHFAARDAWTLPDGTEVRARRRFDAERGISHEVLRWEGPAGEGEKRHSLRIRWAEEVDRLLEEAGLEVTARYGRWSGEAFHAQSPRLIVVAERR